MTDTAILGRRRFLDLALSGSALALGGLALLRSGAARAQKAPKASVQYQEEPKRVNDTTQKCSNCQFYIPPEETGSDVGKCQVVEGAIAPDAWCTLWAPEA